MFMRAKTLEQAGSGVLWRPFVLLSATPSGHYFLALLYEKKHAASHAAQDCVALLGAVDVQVVGQAWHLFSQVGCACIMRHSIDGHTYSVAEDLVIFEFHVRVSCCQVPDVQQCGGEGGRLLFPAGLPRRRIAMVGIE